MSADLNRGEIRISVVMLTLTMSAGAIDAITYLGLGHAFAALTTGNMLLLGFGVAQTAGTPIARPAEALAAFALGVTLAHALIARLNRRGGRWFVAGLAVEVVLLAAAGLYAVGVSGSAPLTAGGQAVTVVLLATAMGWRMRVMVEAHVPEMPTTVLQIALVKSVTDVLSGRLTGPADARLASARRIATIVGLFAGGAAGALLLRLGPGPALLCIAAAEACLTTLYARAPRYRPPAAGEEAAAGQVLSDRSRRGRGACRHTSPRCRARPGTSRTRPTLRRARHGAGRRGPIRRGPIRLGVEGGRRYRRSGQSGGGSRRPL